MASLYIAFGHLHPATAENAFHVQHSKLAVLLHCVAVRGVHLRNPLSERQSGYSAEVTLYQFCARALRH